MDFVNHVAVSQGILDFIHQLPNGYSNYPEHVLMLLSKHFGQNTLAFIPVGLRYAEMHQVSSDHFVRDYLTLNIPPEWLRDYNRYYHSKDIFRYAALPAELRRKPVVTIEDIMPYDQFRRTEYYLYLQRHGIPHEVIINLNDRDAYLGTVALYQTVDEGPFLPEQIAVFETLSRFIVQHYRLAMESGPRAVLCSLLQTDALRGLSLGVAILDETDTVLEANLTMQHYAQHMCSEGETMAVHKTAQGEHSSYPEVQQMFNSMGSGALRRGGPVQYTCGDRVYEFHTGSMVSPARNLSKMESLHIVFVNVTRGGAGVDRVSLGELTARETEIVALVAQGCSNTQIAQAMHISIHTVKTHILNIYKKQGVNSRTALLHKLHSSG